MLRAGCTSAQVHESSSGAARGARVPTAGCPTGEGQFLGPPTLYIGAATTVVGAPPLASFYSNLVVLVGWLARNWLNLAERLLFICSGGARGPAEGTAGRRLESEPRAASRAERAPRLAELGPAARLPQADGAASRPALSGSSGGSGGGGSASGSKDK